MATLKHLKLKEDEHRLMLENGIKALLASQAKVAEALDSVIRQLTILSEQGHMVVQKEKEKVNVKRPAKRA